MYTFFIVAKLSLEWRSLALCGGAHVLGGWNVQKALAMQPLNDLGFGAWNFTVSVNLSSVGYRYLEYRYIKVSKDGRVEWEAQPFNRNLLVVPQVQYTLHDGNFGLPMPSPTLAPRGPTLPPARGWRVVICGSSVAFGASAVADRGWAARLAEALQNRYGHQTVNVAVHGYDTRKTRADFQRLVASMGPDVVVIGLSLANEGLAWQPAKLWRSVARSFQHGIGSLVEEVLAINATPVVGDVYPHGAYWAQMQQKLLQDTHRMLLNSSVPLLNWLGALDNGSGRWQNHHMADAGHPNTLGHQVMFEAIDLYMFDPSNVQNIRR